MDEPGNQSQADFLFLQEVNLEDYGKSFAEQQAAGKAYREGFVKGYTEGHAKGHKEGLLEGLREALMSAIELRFPDIAEEAQEKMKQIRKPAKLRVILEGVKKVSRGQAMLGALEVAILNLNLSRRVSRFVRHLPVSAPPQSNSPAVATS